MPFTTFQRWLERTPGLSDNFNFWKKYTASVNQWLNDQYLQPALVCFVTFINNYVSFSVFEFFKIAVTEVRQRSETVQGCIFRGQGV